MFHESQIVNVNGNCKCGKPYAKSKRMCQDCHNAYMREWRKTHRNTPEQRGKDNARSHVSMAIRRGMIKRGNCQYCGTPENIEAHHQDYSKRLLIVWLCKQHHRDVTNKVLPDNFLATDYSRKQNRANYQAKYQTA